MIQLTMGPATIHFLCTEKEMKRFKTQVEKKKGRRTNVYPMGEETNRVPNVSKLDGILFDSVLPLCHKCHQHLQASDCLEAIGGNMSDHSQLFRLISCWNLSYG